MNYFKAITTFCFLLVATAAFAQSEPPTPPNSGNAPIDGAIALLALAGAGYGAYRKHKS